jgi:uncharacterized protein YukE
MADFADSVRPFSQLLYERADVHQEQRQSLAKQAEKTKEVWNSEAHDVYQGYAKQLLEDGVKDEELLRALAETMSVAGYLHEYCSLLAQTRTIFEELASTSQPDSVPIPSSPGLEEWMRLTELARMAEGMEGSHARATQMTRSTLLAALSILDAGLRTHFRKQPPEDKGPSQTTDLSNP